MMTIWTLIVVAWIIHLALNRFRPSKLVAAGLLLGELYCVLAYVFKDQSELCLRSSKRLAETFSSGKGMLANILIPVVISFFVYIAAFSRIPAIQDHFLAKLVWRMNGTRRQRVLWCDWQDPEVARLLDLYREGPVQLYQDLPIPPSLLGKNGRQPDVLPLHHVRPKRLRHSGARSCENLRNLSTRIGKEEKEETDKEDWEIRWSFLEFPSKWRETVALDDFVDSEPDLQRKYHNRRRPDGLRYVKPSIIRSTS